MATMGAPARAPARARKTIPLSSTETDEMTRVGSPSMASSKRAAKSSLNTMATSADESNTV